MQANRFICLELLVFLELTIYVCVSRNKIGLVGILKRKTQNSSGKAEQSDKYTKFCEEVVLLKLGSIADKMSEFIFI